MNTIDITAVILLEVHVSYPTASAGHEKQNTGHDDCPSYAYTRQTCTLRPDSGPCCHTRVYRTRLPERHRRHQHLWHSVYTRNRLAPLHVCYDLGAGEDIHEQFVWRENCVDLPGDAPRLPLPTLVKSASIGGLKVAMEWAWAESTFIYVGNKVKKNISPQTRATPES